MDFAAITGGMLFGFILILLVSSFFLWLGAKIAGIEHCVATIVSI